MNNYTNLIVSLVLVVLMMLVAYHTGNTQYGLLAVLAVFTLAVLVRVWPAVSDHYFNGDTDSNPLTFD